MAALEWDPRDVPGWGRPQYCPMGTSTQVGCGSGQPGVVAGSPAHTRGLKQDDRCGPFQPRPYYDSMGHSLWQGQAGHCRLRSAGPSSAHKLAIEIRVETAPEHPCLVPPLQCPFGLDESPVTFIPTCSCNSCI